MDSPYLAVQQRAVLALYNAEQQRRQTLEEECQRLTRLLEDLAQRHYGPALEARRRTDPRLPKGWTAQTWQQFFAQPCPDPRSPALLPTTWATPLQNSPSPASQEVASEPTPGVRAELEELRGLRARNQELTTQLRALAHRPPPPRPPPGVPAKAGLALRPAAPPAPEPRGPLAAFKPPSCPLAWQSRFTGWPELHWRRGTMLVFLLAQGLSAFMEISQHITDAEGLSDRSNSVRHPLEKLEKAGLVVSETLSLDLGEKKPALKLIRLTPLGEEFCQALGWEVQEAEWARLIRLHEGTRFPEHTVAVLAFAMNARARNWQVVVLPEVPGPARPDVQVTQGSEQHYVEVELGLKDRPAKWRNLAGLQGHVALCARDVAGRARLVGDCRLAKLSGLATDLETLVLATPYRDLTPEHPLWPEMWN